MFQDITLKEIVSLNKEALPTLSSKIIYLLILKQADNTGWSSISLDDFEKTTGMSKNSVSRVLNRLIKAGLIERNPNKKRPNSANEYRVG